MIDKFKCKIFKLQSQVNAQSAQAAAAADIQKQQGLLKAKYK